MDYLLSLVGQDQDTIVDAIKDLAANAEKVKDQEMEIKELYSKLDDNKEEIHYLKNKLEQKYDLIDDMEHDLDKIERKLKEAKENLEQKETDFNRLKMLISEQVEEINVLRETNFSMVNQIAENISMEEKIMVQDAVIKDLSDKGDIETNKEMHEVTVERDNLLLEVDHLEKENEEKLKCWK
jgi:chromosome segregation ATPase